MIDGSRHDLSASGDTDARGPGRPLPSRRACPTTRVVGGTCTQERCSPVAERRSTETTRVTAREPDDAIRIRSLQAPDMASLARMFSEFEAYIASLDSSGVLVRSLPPTYGEAYLDKALKEVDQQGGTVLVAEEGTQIVGF